MGQALIPWQRHAADVLGTLRPDGRPRYKTGVVIVPRRAGKTWLQLCQALTVGRRRGMSRSFYTSFRRETAAALWRDEWFPMLELSPLHPRFLKLRQSNGSEAITWRHNRSTFRLLPPAGDAMRSFRSDLAHIDEARLFSLAQGVEIERATFPTQATGYGGQTILWSNSGNEDSTWLEKWRDLGRASTEDPDSDIAYIEYGVDPLAAGFDASSPATWAAAHPAYGYHLLPDAIAADYERMSIDDFGAEYLGIWSGGLIDRKLVDAWAALDTGTPAGVLSFAVEIDYDRERAVIVAVGDGHDDRPAVELVDDREHGPGLLDRLGELISTHRPGSLVWDAGGPANSLAHDFGRLAVNCAPFRTNDVTAAAGAFYDRIIGGRLLRRDDPGMVDAIAAARRRAAGGAWLFDRRTPGALPVIAASMAAWRWSDERTRRPTTY
jgi:hypothetical protein